MIINATVAVVISNNRDSMALQLAPEATDVGRPLYEGCGL